MADNIDTVISNPIEEVENRSTSTNAKYKEKNSTDQIIKNLLKRNNEKDDEIKKLENELTNLRNNRKGKASEDLYVIESLEREITEKDRTIEFMIKEKKRFKVQKGEAKSMEDKIGLMKIDGLKKVLRRFGERTSGNKNQLRLRMEKLTKLFKNDCKRTADLGKLSKMVLDPF